MVLKVLKLHYQNVGGVWILFPALLKCAEDGKAACRTNSRNLFVCFWNTNLQSFLKNSYNVTINIVIQLIGPQTTWGSYCSVPAEGSGEWLPKDQQAVSLCVMDWISKLHFRTDDFRCWAICDLTGKRLMSSYFKTSFIAEEELSMFLRYFQGWEKD